MYQQCFEQDPSQCRVSAVAHQTAERQITLQDVGQHVEAGQRQDFTSMSAKTAAVYLDMGVYGGCDYDPVKVIVFRHLAFARLVMIEAKKTGADQLATQMAAFIQYQDPSTAQIGLDLVCSAMAKDADCAADQGWQEQIGGLVAQHASTSQASTPQQTWTALQYKPRRIGQIGQKLMAQVRAMALFVFSRLSSSGSQTNLALSKAGAAV